MDLGDLLSSLLPFLIALIAVMGSGSRKRKVAQRPPRSPGPPVADPFEAFGAPQRPPPPRRPAGERVGPPPFTRDEAPARPAWMQDLEADLERQGDPFGQRRRTLRRAELALEVEAPTRRRPVPMPEPEEAESPAPAFVGRLPRLLGVSADAPAGRPPTVRAIALRAAFRSKSGLRTAILAREVLNRPLSLRSDHLQG